MNILRVVTLFSGYDSQCMSLDRLHHNFPQFDYELIAWSEIDNYAIQAHNAIYPQYADRNLGDVCKIDWYKVEDFDLLTYSSPCQDFSAAGLQKGGIKGSGTRSSLLWECERAIEEKRPKYLLMENVAALVSQKFIKLFNKWQNTLESYGYTNYAKVLNAKDYGVPQNRERIFMVSVRNDINQKFYFPEPFKLERRLKDILEDRVDEKYYLSEKLINYLSKIGGRSCTYKANELINGDTSVGTSITSNYYKNPRQANYVKVEGHINSSQDGIVVNPCGISPTHTSGHGNTPKIIEPTIAAMRTRCEGKWVKGDKHEIKLEIGSNISNSLTRVDKDNVLIEPLNEYEDGVSRTIKSQYAKNGMANFKRSDGLAATGVMQIEPKVEILNKSDKQANRIISDKSDLCTTLSAMQGGNTQPKIIQRPRGYNKGGEHDLCPTTGCNSFQENNILNSGFRIRKLTPTECFRLMDVSDKDIDKLLNSGISNSQLYKLAGNSIVVSCLYHIFRKLFIETENDSRQLELF